MYTNNKEGEVTVNKSWAKEIDIYLCKKTTEENVKVLEKYYDQFRNMEDNPIILQKKVMKHYNFK
jgi:hypothetical protein